MSTEPTVSCTALNRNHKLCCCQNPWSLWNWDLSLPDKIWWVLGRGSLPPCAGLCPACSVTKLPKDLLGGQLYAAWGTAKHFSGCFTLGLCLKMCWTLCLFLRTRAWVVSTLHDGALQANFAVDLLQWRETIPGNSLWTDRQLCGVLYNVLYVLQQSMASFADSNKQRKLNPFVSDRRRLWLNPKHFPAKILTIQINHSWRILTNIKTIDRSNAKSLKNSGTTDKIGASVWLYSVRKLSFDL